MRKRKIENELLQLQLDIENTQHEINDLKMRLTILENKSDQQLFKKAKQTINKQYNEKNG